MSTNVQATMMTMMENPAIQLRFNSILGNRTNKFISALISLINADQNLTAAFQENPSSVLQVALKAASYNLPIGNDLGFAYIVPYKVQGKPSAQFILGYKGIIQLVKRTGICERIGATDVRQGELVKLDRLYGVHQFNWIQDDSVRASAPIIGYVAALREKNGFEKMEYMSVEEMIEFEKSNRKGQFQSPSWKNYFHTMAKKTVLRKLLKAYGNMDIDRAEVAQDVLYSTELEENSPVEIEPTTGELQPVETE